MLAITRTGIGLSLLLSLGLAGCSDDPDLTDTRGDSAGDDVTELDTAVDSGDLDTGSADTSVEDTLTPVDSGTDASVDAVDAVADSTDAVADSAADSVADVVDSAVDMGPPPSVLSTSPIDRRVGVSTATKVKVTFSAPMQIAKVTVQAASGACTGSLQLLEGPAFTSCIGGTVASTDGLTFTFTPAAALGTELHYRVNVANAALAADGRAVTPYAMTTGFMTQRFPVDAKVLYTMGTDGAFGGAAGGDSKCTALATRPAGIATAKAMIADTNRHACTVANCGTGNTQKDWALKPNTHYVRADGKYVFLTDANGIYTAWSGGNDLGTGVNFYDGLNSNWTSRGPNCTDWTVTTGTGAVGYDVGLNSAWLQGGTLPCTSVRPIVCAEQ